MKANINPPPSYTAGMPDTPDHDPLPPNVRRFAPWRWNSTKIIGCALLVGVCCTVAWFALTVLSYIRHGP